MPRPHSQASEHRPATPVTPIGKKQGRPQENGASPKATKDTKLNDTDNNVAEKRAKTEHLAPPLASQKAAAPPLDETDHPSPGLERKESHHPRSRSQTFIQRKDSAGYERRAEAWGAFAQALINLNPLKLKVCILPTEYSSTNRVDLGVQTQR